MQAVIIWIILSQQYIKIMELAIESGKGKEKITLHIR